MPAPLIDKFARRTGKTVDEVEKIWDRAKKIAQKQYGVPSKIKKQNRNRYWGAVTTITKNILGISK